MQNNEPQSPPPHTHNDLDNLDNLTVEQINAFYDDISDDVYIDDLIAVRYVPSKYVQPGI